MKVLLACDKLKGSLTAPEACAAIRDGILSSIDPSRLEIKMLPIADGGDGMMTTLTAALSGTVKSVSVVNALGAPVDTRYGLLDNGKTAVIEMAEASGLALLKGTLDPMSANTLGTGQLIRAAIHEGIERIILGIGGSATNDAGCGMARALGWEFYDSADQPLETIPRDLAKLERAVPPSTPCLPEILVACDVSNPLLGEQGCTRIYGPQKGISENDFEFYEKGLETLVRILDADDAAAQPGAGAAGGLGFGALAFLNATLTPGFELVAGILGLEKAVADADLIITAEGRLDLQSLEGKAPFGVATLAKQHEKPVVTFCGIREGEGLEEHFGEIIEIRDPALSTEQNMANGRSALTEAAAKLGRSLLS